MRVGPSTNLPKHIRISKPRHYSPPAKPKPKTIVGKIRDAVTTGVNKVINSGKSGATEIFNKAKLADTVISNSPPVKTIVKDAKTAGNEAKNVAVTIAKGDIKAGKTAISDINKAGNKVKASLNTAGKDVTGFGNTVKKDISGGINTVRADAGKIVGGFTSIIDFFKKFGLYIILAIVGVIVLLVYMATRHGVNVSAVGA